jgi:hypothetical protein
VKPWTFMIYMAADNDLPDFAETNLQQMQNASRNDVINVIAFVDWPQESDTYVYRIENGTREIIQRTGNVPSYDRGCLEAFLRNTISQYPAKNYCLILWGHGDGIDWAYKDEPNIEGIFTDANGNLMKIAELGAALASLQNGQISVLGFDACLMSMAEVYDQFQNSVRFVVGSANEVPKAGLPYDKILEQLVAQPNMTDADLAKLIVDKFVDFYSHARKKLNISLAACDLRNRVALVSVVKDLSTALTDGLKEPAILKAIIKSRTQAQVSQEHAYVDFGGFCSGLEESGIGKISEIAAGALKTLKGKYVLYPRRFPNDSQYHDSGLNVFFPISLDVRKARHRTAYRSATLNACVDWEAYRGLAFCADTSWDTFIKAFVES